MAWAKTYFPTKKLHFDPSSRLATADMGQKLGRGCVPFWGELGPHLTQCRLGGEVYSIPSGSRILIRPAVWR